LALPIIITYPPKRINANQRSLQLVQIISSADYYNISAKADKCKLGEAPHLVQIIGFDNYYNISAKADKNKSGAALPLVQMISSADYYTFCVT
jgi:hypothetical protein